VPSTNRSLTLCCYPRYLFLRLKEEFVANDPRLTRIAGERPPCLQVSVDTTIVLARACVLSCLPAHSSQLQSFCRGFLFWVLLCGLGCGAATVASSVLSPQHRTVNPRRIAQATWLGVMLCVARYQCLKAQCQLVHPATSAHFR
jgi:hypothetical protein